MTRSLSKAGNKGNRFKLIVMAILTIISIIFALISFITSPTVYETTTTNDINQKCNIQYEAAVKKCILYPDGGIIEPEGALLSTITDYMIFHINSFVEGNDTLRVSGSSYVDAVLISDNYWERHFPLSKESEFDSTAKHITIIDGEFKLNVSEIFGFITQVEAETNAQPYEYYLKILPVINGEITYKEHHAGLESPLPLLFKLTGNSIERVAEMRGEVIANDNSLLFERSTPATEDAIVQQSVVFLGIDLPVIAARSIFIILTAASAIYWILYFRKVRKMKFDLLSEEQIIEKRYAKRILNSNIDIKCLSNQYELCAFKDLVRLADERELPIFKGEQNSEYVYYLVIDTNTVYSYTAEKSKTNIKQSITLNDDWKCNNGEPV